MELREAECQVLASIRKAELEGEPSDRVSLQKGGERYWMFLEDWSNAFPGLMRKGLIAGDDAGYRLTDSGRPLGDAYHRQRPDMYWYYYEKFYPAASASAAHSRLCEQVFGRDLCQEGMVDMGALEHLLSLLDLKPGDRLLDLGCGAGGIAEYISDSTGALVTGLDYAVSAIDEARRRTAAKSDRLSFQLGDMNALELKARAFDAAISLDTLYWVADLDHTLAQIVKTIRRGGQIGIFMLHGIGEGDSPDTLRAENSEAARAMRELGLNYQAHDYTTRNASFWRNNRKCASDLRDEFEAEGNGFIAASLIREADEDFLPAIENGTLARYLYHVQL